jgi:dTDP-4-amino-4,6-dideoxygalactose transaminase
MDDPPPLSVTRVGSRHPDHDWIRLVRSALDRWEVVTPATPTSSVLGGGAVAAAEDAFSRVTGGRPALLLPSATYALRAGLQVLGVRAGDEVLCAAIDWPAGSAAAASLGAVPVGVMTDPATLTIDPAAAAEARTGRTRAVIACHLHGVCADIPALRGLLPGVGILEDAAQGFGCGLDGRPAGSLGDVAVLSLGPGKHIESGEGGVLICGDIGLYRAAVAITCHPLRQLLTGTPAWDPAALSMRPHPMTAILALHALAGWTPRPARQAQLRVRRLLAADARLKPLGEESRHASSHPYVPILVPSGDRPPDPPAGVRWTHSGALVLPCVPPGGREAAANLLGRVRLAAAADHAERRPPRWCRRPMR